MLDAIRYNLANLTRLDGRQARQPFWLYVLFLILLSIAVSLLVSVPMVIKSVQAGFAGAQNGASPDVTAARVMQAMGGSLSLAAWVGVGMGLLQTALLAATFVRRLHDSNKPGWWALVVVILQLVGIAVNVSMIAAMQTAFASGDMTRIQAFSENSRALSLLGWIAPVLVVIFGVLASTPGRNRYGEEPLTA